jgi:superfamily II DNA/RNA helicase
MSFEELELNPALIAALTKQQISSPTPIQIASIPTVAQGKDAYLHAETGTGKTLAYLLPIFSRIDASLAATQCVIVAPTHELAIQIHRQACDLAQNAGWALRSVLLIGGTATDRQIEKLKKKPHLVVGSPGRIEELIERGKLKMQHVRSIVIDEADRLLNEESIDPIKAIIATAPIGRQLIFASATLDPDSTAALKDISPEITMIQAGVAKVNENIEHLYLECEERDKPDVLRKLLHALDCERAIVFVHRNEVAAVVASKLEHHKVRAADLNAALNKVDRKHAMDGIRNGSIRVLIASDVAARGLDVKGISHVFNLDVPTTSQGYLHRVGRTGRAGSTGIAITLMTESEARLVRRYEQELGITMQCVRVRDGEVRSVDPARSH